MSASLWLEKSDPACWSADWCRQCLEHEEQANNVWRTFQNHETILVMPGKNVISEHSFSALCRLADKHSCRGAQVRIAWIGVCVMHNTQTSNCIYFDCRFLDYLVCSTFIYVFEQGILNTWNLGGLKSPQTPLFMALAMCCQKQAKWTVA